MNPLKSAAINLIRPHENLRTPHVSVFTQQPVSEQLTNIINLISKSIRKNFLPHFFPNSHKHPSTLMNNILKRTCYFHKKTGY